MRMIKGIEESVTTGDIYPERGRKCDSCNMKVSCEGKLKDALDSWPAQDNGQGLFDFAASTYEKRFIVNEGRDPLTMSAPMLDLFGEGIDSEKQRSINFKRKTSY